MTLILAVADAGMSAGLLNEVNDFEAGAVVSADLASVIRACRNTVGPDCVICSDLDWARQIVDAAPRLPVVLATLRAPDADLLLSALRAGLADVWPMPMASDWMHARLEAVRARASAPVSSAEQQLLNYSQALERDQRAGRHLQMSLLPAALTTIGHYRFEHRIEPSMFMSGDFVDCFPVTERHFVFYLADVSGHGAAAAFVTVLLKEFSRRLRQECEPRMLGEPGRILSWINEQLLDRRIDRHVVVILGVGDLVTDEIALVNGGHHPPAVRVSAEGPELLRQKGKPIGLFEQVSYEARVVGMQPGDRLVLCSDGVLDAMGSGSLEMREARFLAAAGAGGGLSDIWASLDVDGGELRKPDDMTCLVVRREN